eukprot:scaffold57995_cov72-Phaeocystis_antarctica.AAC.2
MNGARLDLTFVDGAVGQIAEPHAIPLARPPVAKEALAVCEQLGAHTLPCPLIKLAKVGAPPRTRGRVVHVHRVTPQVVAQQRARPAPPRRIATATATATVAAAAVTAILSVRAVGVGLLGFVGAF